MLVVLVGFIGLLLGYLLKKTWLREAKRVDMSSFFIMFAFLRWWLRRSIKRCKSFSYFSDLFCTCLNFRNDCLFERQTFVIVILGIHRWLYSGDGFSSLLLFEAGRIFVMPAGTANQHEAWLPCKLVLTALSCISYHMIFPWIGKFHALSLSKFHGNVAS